MTKVGFVCTNYKNAHYTREAVRSLLANQGHEIRIAIVDNDSGPEDAERLRKISLEFSGVHVIFNSANVGYFRGLNEGIHYLRSTFPDIDRIIVGNNDLLFPLNFCEKLANLHSVFAIHPVVSPDIVTLDGMHQNPHVRNGITARRELLYDIYYSNYYIAIAMGALARWTARFTDRDDESFWETPQRIDQGHGSCYILGPLFFNNFAELWAPTFMMGEEYFLSKQLMDRGMMVYYEPSISVRHCYHATVAQVPRKLMWKMARDAHRVYRRHVGVIARNVK